MVAAPFYLWFVEELCHFSIKLGVVFILLHLAKGSFFFTCLRFLKGSALAQLMGEFFRFRYACLRAVHSVGYT